MRLSAQDARKQVFKIQLSRRMGYDTQGKNVKVTVGNSLTYDSNDPVCTEIAQLVQQTGSTLVEYACDKAVAGGEYVKFSTDQRYLTICEAKVFVQGMMT